jgi:hypothetical protein
MSDLAGATLPTVIRAPEAGLDLNPVTHNLLIGGSAANLTHLAGIAKQTTKGRNGRSENIPRRLAGFDDLVNTVKRLLKHDDHGGGSYNL